jgi:hypothetical protein
LNSIPATPEVFDHDRGVGAHQAVCSRAIRAWLGATSPRRGLRPGPCVRASTSGRLALRATRLPLGDLQVAWVGGDLTGRKHPQGT